MKAALLTGAAGLCLAMGPSLAFAQPAERTTTTTEVKEDNSGTASGAIAGGLIGGPVGAVVGAVAGGTVGHTVDPPHEARAYVTTQTVESAPCRDKIVLATPSTATWSGAKRPTTRSIAGPISTASAW